jgi:hypothetical protein
MLCEICGFHGGAYEECRLVGYMKPVLLSHEPYYFSAKEASWFILLEIRGFHGGDYEDFCKNLRRSLQCISVASYC